MSKNNIPICIYFGNKQCRLAIVKVPINNKIGICAEKQFTKISNLFSYSGSWSSPYLPKNVVNHTDVLIERSTDLPCPSVERFRCCSSVILSRAFLALPIHNTAS